MMDEYSRLREFDSPGFITGKPLVLGGSQGRETATAQGVTICIEEAVKEKRDQAAKRADHHTGFWKRGKLSGQIHARCGREGGRDLGCPWRALQPGRS